MTEPMPIHEYEIFLRLGTAIALGGAIGFEREAHEQPAGLRTHILVALASATFILVSAHFVFYQHYVNDGIVRVDVGRIASNVVVGIGFLGGGAILHSGLRIKGLTTAASLWLVAAIGLASGAGMFLLAATVTLLDLFALEVLRKLVEEPRKRSVLFRVHIDMEGGFVSRVALTKFLASIGATLCQVDYSRDFKNNRSELDAQIRLPTEDLEESLVQRLETLPGVLLLKVERADP